MVGNSVVFDDPKFQTGEFKRGPMMSGLADFDAEAESSSDDDGGDEAEKFVQQTIKNIFTKKQIAKIG